MKIYTVKVDEFGTKRWYLNDKLHRTDGPAVEFDNCAKYWYLNGLVHREDGPAIEFADGSKYWYLNGKRYFPDWRNNPNYLNKLKAPCVGKIVEVDGVKYKLVEA